MVYPSVQFSEKNIPLSEALPIIVDFNRRLAECVSDAIGHHFFPVVIGGDHCNAIGTWNAVACSLNEPLGLIWIDAHMDAHTKETSPSGAWHGMPLACLMGYGVKELAQLKRERPILNPKHLCLIGVRSFEEGEAALLKRLNVKIYYIDEVKRRGLHEVLKEAIDHVNQGTKGYGVSLDVDVIDPSEAPGTGSLEPKDFIECVLTTSLGVA
jgi:arginase